MELEQTVVPETTEICYSAPATDTSSIKLVIRDGLVTLSYGGSALVVPREDLSVIVALTSTAAAGVAPIVPEEPV